MGEIVAAAIVSHHPGLMLPEPVRIQFGNGKDSDLIAGFGRVRKALDEARPDTLVIFDTHWFTTMNNLVTGAAEYRGWYTSDELPDMMCDLPFEFPGNPELADAIESVAKERGLRALAVKSTNMALHYPTLNLVHWLRKGERIVSVGVCQHAGADDYLAFGAAIGEAIRRTNVRAALLASGALSHEFTPFGAPPRNPSFFHPDNITRPEHRELDMRVLDLLAKGDHAAVVELYPALRKAKIEGFGGHYLQMLGALGGPGVRAKGRAMSEYESALGTGNIHVWFDLGSSEARAS
jgi:3,4-dihydroxyphenylacetate 2,3-dioxygenase